MLIFSSKSEMAEDKSSSEGLLPQAGNREAAEDKQEQVVTSGRLANGN